MTPEEILGIFCCKIYCKIVLDIQWDTVLLYICAMENEAQLRWILNR
jgi:hypothetical protein